MVTSITSRPSGTGGAVGRPRDAQHQGRVATDLEARELGRPRAEHRERPALPARVEAEQVGDGAARRRHPRAGATGCRSSAGGARSARRPRRRRRCAAPGGRRRAPTTRSTRRSRRRTGGAGCRRPACRRAILFRVAASRVARSAPGATLGSGAVMVARSPPGRTTMRSTSVCARRDAGAAQCDELARTFHPVREHVDVQVVALELVRGSPRARPSPRRNPAPPRPSWPRRSRPGRSWLVASVHRAHDHPVGHLGVQRRTGRDRRRPGAPRARPRSRVML